MKIIGSVVGKACLAWLVLLGTVPVAEPAPAKRHPPNIVIIFADDLGYGDLGVFGAQGFKTPNLDKLASQGTVFRNFHVAQAVCSASRAALLTGCYPNRIGIHGALGPRSNTGIHPDETTLAELLQQPGYATALIGKWHLGDHPTFLPTRHGFDQFFGLPYSNDMWPLHPDLVKLPPGSERKRGYPDLPLYEGDKILNPKVTSKDQDQLTSQYTRRAVHFIESHKNRPFLLYLAHSMPHVPLAGSEQFRGKSARGLYGDVIEEIDWSVGQVLEALDRTGVAEQTLVIFTSDNGPWLSYGNHAGSSGALREGKGTSWEGGTRVPCIMRWPGRIKPARVSNHMLMTIDLFPTIAKLTGASLPPHKLDGLDVWPILTGKRGAKNPHPAYWFYYEQNQLQAVTTGDGRWKLVLPHSYRTLAGHPGGTNGTPASYVYRKLTQPELYDLSQDISESQDLASKHADIVKMLEAHAEQARNELGDALTGRTGRGSRDVGRLSAQP